jgi:hypothetical protein
MNIRYLLALVLLLTSGRWAQATVIEELSFEGLVSQSQLVVLAEVSAMRQQQEGELIYTYVTLTVSERYKGQSPAEIELRFVGGENASVAVDVAGQFIPALHSRGVFFIETLAVDLVNPLTGWQQGFFPVFSVNGGQLYLDMQQRPDFVIPGLARNPLASKMQSIGMSAAAIANKAPADTVFTLADFSAAIRAEVATPSGTAP